jgi:hypothetical protein
MKYTRIYADPTGESHFMDVEIGLEPVDFDSFGDGGPELDPERFDKSLAEHYSRHSHHCHIFRQFPRTIDNNAGCSHPVVEHCRIHSSSTDCLICMEVAETGSMSQANHLF